MFAEGGEVRSGERGDEGRAAGAEREGRGCWVVDSGERKKKIWNTTFVLPCVSETSNLDFPESLND